MRYGVEGLNIYTYSRFPPAVKNAFIDGYEIAKSAYGRGAYTASTPFKKAKAATYNDIRENARERDQLYLSEANDSGKAFREGVRAGIRVVQQEVGSGRTAYGMRFNRTKRKNSPKARDLAQKALDRSKAKNYKQAKAWVRAKGTKEMQRLLASGTAAGRAFREHLRTMPGFYDWAAKMDREGAFTNPRKRRRRNPTEALYREAEAAGLSRAYVDRVARARDVRRSRAFDEVPPSVSRLRKDHDGNSYIPVRTAHNTHWHYTLKKQARGWVAEFRRRDKQSKAHYISRVPAASLKKTYYKTKAEAYRQAARHIMQGKHAPYRNPSKRRR